ncbi:sulfatase-like hydrolase/transferase [Formosa sp. PL04]|uniref:sulfatase-like hydrolase/transferase n=1 Tax=Formosa sp. PL04 TaxID=3081755 RepID=UPI00298124A3|nr:sulfatase-like hydrolase/transferase [Formosa sp. PL04]MDW5290116.1 sulfatase-like hydrolase/transferase [Formosa sp. PL04]
MKSHPLILAFLSLTLLLSCKDIKEKSIEQKQEKPNIVFIFADDQMFESIGALHDIPIQTPNLDRLVEKGTNFSNTFNQGSFAAAVCVASRTMLLTGGFLWDAASYSKSGRNTKDPNAPKIGQPATIPFKAPEKYWPHFMKEAGYETYMTGKWHVGEVNPEHIFDHTSHVRGGMPKQSKTRYQRTFDENKEDIWSPYDEKFGGYWEGGKHWSEIVGDDGVSFIENAKTIDKPFFMYLAFNSPHDPRQSPKRFVDMYPIDSIKVPENFIPEYPYNEYAGAGRKLRDEMLAPFPRTEHSVKVNRQEYYAIITHMDEQIGRVLDALEASGKADNTYVIFTADHGLALGDHGFMGKQNMYDSSMRVPLLITGPDIPKNKTIDAFVYLQDVMATALDIAEVEKPAQVDFNTLLPLATGKTNKSNYEAVYGAYFGTQRMYRTKQYKLIIYPTANMVRLYDIKNDPSEKIDLAENKEKHEALLKELLKEFQMMQKEMEDPIDVSKAFDNFMNNVPPPVLQ